MKKIIYIIYLALLTFELTQCSNPSNDSFDKILAANKQVWDSLGWMDSSSLGVRMPLYKMVEQNEPLNINDLNQRYEYVDSSIWVFNDMRDVIDYEPPIWDTKWDFWKGRESILSRLNDYPITIKSVSWSLEGYNSLYMYYKCVDNDSLVPIDGFMFNWYRIPWIFIELSYQSSN